MNTPYISIVIINYNGGANAQQCLEALHTHTNLPFEIIVVDNASSDGSALNLEQSFPNTLKVIYNTDNVGYARGINIGLSEAQGEYVVVMNMDLIATTNWLPPMISYLQTHPDVACVTPLILLHDKPDRINALGQNINVTGLGFNRKLNQAIAFSDTIPTHVSGVHGSVFMMRTKQLKDLHGMNKFYFLYHEDVELSLRINIAGYKIYTVPASVVLHMYDLHMTPQKLNWLERHRWMSMLSVYHKWTYVILMPLFLLTELMMLSYCLMRGLLYLKAKANAIRWVLTHWQDVQASRYQMQSLRKVSDRYLLSILSWSYNWEQFVILARQSGGWLYEAMSSLFTRRTHDRVA